ncbi:MAG: HEAT repeat domain-containing protein [Rhodothermales bacterium]
MRLLALALLAALSTVLGCTRPPVTGKAAPPQPPEAAYARPSDALLQRPDLQVVVERQTRRNAAVLRDRLTSKVAAVRARAALALGSVQDTAAVPLLLFLLDDPSPLVRADVAFALGQSAGEAAELPLIAALRDEADPAVQRLLLEALGKTGGEATLSALPGLPFPASLDPDRAIAIARYGLRGVHDRDAVDWLARHLTDPDPDLREHAAYYFGRIADPDPWRYASDLVIAASDSLAPSDPAQQYLALALGRLDADGTEARLVQLLRKSEDWRVRTNAARALARPTSSSFAHHALLVALDDPSTHVAAAAAGALAAADTLDAERLDLLEVWADAHPARWRVWAPLLSALAQANRVDAVLARVRDLGASRSSALPAHEIPFARAAALGGLAGVLDPAALDLVRTAADDPDARVAYAALEALKASWADEHTAERAPFYFDLFARALRRRDLATAYAAAPALADSLFRPLGASTVLRETYGEMSTPDDIEPMVEIVRALGEIRDTTAVPFLLEVALEGPHPTIRQAAATTLSERFGEGIDFEATGLMPPDFPAFDWDYLRSLGRHPRLQLQTDRGEVVIELDTEAAPLTVQTLTRTAGRGDYDGVPFHRVVSNFVVQGGDYVRADGFGGPGLFLPSEFARVPYERGTIGMASAGKDTEGSQFFVTHSMQPHLDGRYTAFGRVVRGQDVVDELLQGDRVLRATVQPDDAAR